MRDMAAARTGFPWLKGLKIYAVLGRNLWMFLLKMHRLVHNPLIHDEINFLNQAIFHHTILHADTRYDVGLSPAEPDEAKVIRM